MSSEGANAQPAADSTPISPVERRNSLEKHLQHRPDPQDLKNRHILLDTTAAPSLQSAQQGLERQRITDNLKRGLTRRPEKEVLIEREWLRLLVYVLHGCALSLPILQPYESFFPCFAHRNTRVDNRIYTTGNILPDSTAAPAIQGQQRELERHMRADSLEKRLQNRPKPEELVKGGILEADENPLEE
ncbi:hypothetical protein LTR60_000897 [Cryomyces antarcticus]|nr:hypothetical protein LTR60_000897 [Cryomyces antarcticus]